MKLIIDCSLENIVTNIDGTVTYYFKNKDNNLKFNEKLKEMQDKSKNGLELQIQPFSKKRSLNANAYLWVLCDEIAKVLKSTKEEIYKKFIKEKGVFEILPIKSTVVNEFIRKWEKNGIGYFCEVFGESKIKNYTNLIVYFGTSTYNQKEMADLLDEIVLSAKELGIETRTPEQLKDMINLMEQ